MTYEELLIEADEHGFIVKEKPLWMNDGLIKGQRIAIRKDIPSQRRKAEILLEEIEHGYSSYGCILDQRVPLNRLQELRARRRAYRRQLPFDAIVKAYEAGCRSLFEMSEELDITEDFLRDSLDWYAEKYGANPIHCDKYLIYFYPHLHVVKLLDAVEEKAEEPKKTVTFVRRLSDKDIDRLIRKHRKEKEIIEKKLRTIEKRCRERNRYLKSIGRDPYQYGFDLAERQREETMA